MNSNRILVHCIAQEDIEGLSNILQEGQFDISVHTHGEPMPMLDDFGAIFCVARSSSAIETLIADERPGILAEEWVLVDSDDDNDIHCVAQLTKSASSRLKTFVRALWARFQVP